VVRVPASPIVLASRSPRRAELLTAAGIPFEVLVADVDESTRPNEPPQEYVERLAIDKASAISGLRGDALVVGADTTVVVDGLILGKPRDRAEATGMLWRLNGRSHDVLTGVAVAGPRGTRSAVDRTRVWFDPMTAEEIGQYVASGEPLDKAGAYAIQGLASRYIPRIEGSYTNVVGLPVALVVRLIAEVQSLPKSQP
jgi:septum formation protein